MYVDLPFKVFSYAGVTLISSSLCSALTCLTIGVLRRYLHLEYSNCLHEYLLWEWYAESGEAAQRTPSVLRVAGITTNGKMILIRSTCSEYWQDISSEPVKKRLLGTSLGEQDISSVEW